MANITYSPIRIETNEDGTPSYIADVVVSGDNFSGDFTVLLPDGSEAELTVDANQDNKATLVFLNEVSGSVDVSIPAEAFESGDQPSGVEASLVVDETAVADGTDTTTGGDGTDTTTGGDGTDTTTGGDGTDTTTGGDGTDTTTGGDGTDTTTGGDGTDLVAGTLTYSATAVNEDVANDGGISDVITLTLEGDTFYTGEAGELIGTDLNTALGENSVISNANIPEGLVAVLTLVDETTAELSFTGTAVNNAEVDSASAIQVSLPSTFFTSNIVAEGADQELSIAFQDSPSLVVDGALAESGKDNGTITGKVTFTLHNADFSEALIGTDLNADGSYIENVPAGLTAKLDVIDATHAELTLEGTAESSNAADSINDLTIGFKAEDFASGNLPDGADLQTVGVSFIEPSLKWSESVINDGEHDGFADQTATLTLTDGAKFIKAGLDLSKFVVKPAGLENVTVSLITTSDTEATLTVNGEAASFDATSLTLNLPKLAFENRMDVAGRDSSIALTFEDTTPPSMPAFDTVATDNVIDDQERTDGVTITGTGEAGSTIKLTFGTTGSATVVDDGAAAEASVITYSPITVTDNGDGTFSNSVDVTLTDDNFVDGSIIPVTFTDGTVVDATLALVDVADPTSATLTFDGDVVDGVTVSLPAEALESGILPTDGSAEGALAAVPVDPTTTDGTTTSVDTTATDGTDTTIAAEGVVYSAITTTDNGDGTFSNSVDVTLVGDELIDGTIVAVTLADGSSVDGSLAVDATDATKAVLTFDGEVTADGVTISLPAEAVASGNVPVGADATLYTTDTTAGDGTDTTAVDGTDTTAGDGTDVTTIEHPTTTGEVTNAFATAEVTVNADGTWSYDLKDTDYPANHETLMVGAVAVDEAGNTSDSSVVQIDLKDTTGPVLTLDKVAGDDAINKVEKDAGVTITGTTEADAEVTVMLGDATSEPIKADATGKWEYALTDEDYASVVYESGAVSGTLAVKVSAKDAAGNESTDVLTADISVADYTAPAMPEISNNDQDPIVAKVTTLSGTAEPNSTLKLTFGDELNGITRTVVVNGDGTWTRVVSNLDVAALEDVEVPTITAIAIDAAGNQSEPKIFTLKPDTTAPSAPVIDDIAGDNSIDSTEKADGVTITGTAEVNAKVVLTFADGTTTAEATTAADGTWEYILTDADYEAGVDTISVTATDVAGNESDAATIAVMLVDTAAPEAPVFDVVADDDIIDAIEKQAGVNLTGTAEADSEITLTFADGTTIETTVTAADGTWEYTLTDADYEAGLTNITAIATDAAGNESEVTAKDVTVILDNTAPTAAATAPVVEVGAEINDAEEAAGIVAVASLQDTGAVEGDTVELLLAGASFATPLTAVLTAADILAGAANITIPTGALGVDGDKVLSSKVTDIAGNVGAVSPELTLTLDTAVTAPTFALKTDNGVSSTDSSSTDGTITVSGLEAGATWKYSVDGTTFNVGTGDSFVLPVATYAAGTVKVQQTDVAGNTSDAGSNAAALEILSPFVQISATTASATTATPYDASVGATAFNVAEGDYTYNIAKFGDDDAIDFPAANSPTVKNTNFTDGNVDLQYANNGHVATVHLSGLTAAQDAALYSVGAFNTLFGANTVTNTGTGAVTVTTPTTTPTSGTTSTVTVTAAGAGDALTGSNVKFDLASGTYNYTIANFGAGDVLNFPDDVAATVKNSNFTDNSVDVQWAANGQVVTVTLTGLANDAALYSTNSFNAAFGAGSII